MTLELIMDEPQTRLLEIAKQVARTHSESGARAAVSTLIAQLGVRVPLRSESYYEVALDYYSALLEARTNRPERAVELLRRSSILPGSGGNQLFADHVRESLEMHARLMAARARGMPTFLIASMPRAASATLTQTLATMLDLPLYRISLFRWLIRPWLDTISPGGGILHDHFDASRFNLDVMRGGGVREVFVLIRDPRAAAASLHRLRQRRDHAPTPSPEQHEAEMIALCRSDFLDWLQGWIDLATNPAGGIRVHWIDSRDVRADMAKVWRGFVDLLGTDYPAIRAYGERELPSVKANFVKGDDDSWRERVSDEGQATLWNAISPAMRDLLDLRP